MKASSFASILRDTQVEKDIAKKLRQLDETDAFQFVLDMLDVNEFVALELAQKCLRTKDYFVRLLRLALERGTACSMEIWLRCVVARLGVRKVLDELTHLVDSQTVGISKMLFFLPRYVDENDSKSTEILLKIRMRVSELHPGT